MVSKFKKSLDAKKRKETNSLLRQDREVDGANRIIPNTSKPVHVWKKVEKKRNLDCIPVTSIMQTLHNSVRKPEIQRHQPRSGVFDTVSGQYVIVEDDSSPSEHEEIRAGSPSFSQTPMIEFPSEDCSEQLPLAMVYPASDEDVITTNRFDLLADIEEKATVFDDNFNDVEEPKLLLWADEVERQDNKKAKKHKKKAKAPVKSDRPFREIRIPVKLSL
ncbi:hypothetical protein M5689_025140 [Euphorbia peplus]|nr:hypothetical protein M5689_025140 [Euphorbia peplus]